MSLGSDVTVNGLQWRRLVALAVIMSVTFAGWLMYLSPLSLGGPVSLTWVSGTSMEPGMYTGDLAIMYRQDSYAVGDVVSFEIPEGGVVIHRIETASDVGYTFIGDNRKHSDPWTLDESAIRGKQLFHVPNLAYAMSYVAQPFMLSLLVGVLVVLFIWKRDLENAGPISSFELPWGPAEERIVPLVMPSPRRLVRKRRARSIVDDYRVERDAFREWPTLDNSYEPPTPELAAFREWPTLDRSYAPPPRSRSRRVLLELPASTGS